MVILFPSVFYEQLHYVQADSCFRRCSSVYGHFLFYLHLYYFFTLRLVVNLFSDTVIISICVSCLESRFLDLPSDTSARVA